MSYGRASCCHPQPCPVVPTTRAQLRLTLRPSSSLAPPGPAEGTQDAEAPSAPWLMWTALVPSQRSHKPFSQEACTAPSCRASFLPTSCLPRGVCSPAARPAGGGTARPSWGRHHLWNIYPRPVYRQGLVPEASAGGARHSQPNFPQALGSPLPVRGDGQCLPMSSWCLWAFPKQRPPNAFSLEGRGPWGP